MKIPLYTLGFLQRFGPQHGYRLRQCLERVADFANIKLPTVYYHLGKMEKKELITASREKEGNRPEKSVYTITDAGRTELQRLLHSALDTPYDAEFLLDAAIYFADFLKPEEMIEAFTRRIETLNLALREMAQHKDETLQHLSEAPEHTQTIVNAIFSHHELHYRAELQWMEETLKGFSSSAKTAD